jgi:hypothetical protein
LFLRTAAAEVIIQLKTSGTSKKYLKKRTQNTQKLKSKICLGTGNNEWLDFSRSLSAAGRTARKFVY